MFWGTQQCRWSRWQLEGFSADLSKIYFKLICSVLSRSENQVCFLEKLLQINNKIKTQCASVFGIGVMWCSLHKSRTLTSQQGEAQGLRETITVEWLASKIRMCLLSWHKSVKCKSGESMFVWAKCWCWGNIHHFKDCFSYIKPVVSDNSRMIVGSKEL